MKVLGYHDQPSSHPRASFQEIPDEHSYKTIVDDPRAAAAGSSFRTADLLSRPPSLITMSAKPAQEGTRSSDSTSTFPVLTAVLCVFFLTVNTIIAAIKARHDLWAVAFVVSVYVLIVLFFLCIYIADRMPIDSPKRARLKLPIWVIITTLLLLIGYRTTAVLSPGFAWPVWVLAALSSGLYFWILFLERPRDGNSGCAGDCSQTNPGHAQKLPPKVVDA